MTERRRYVLFGILIAAIALWVVSDWPWWAVFPLLIAPPALLTALDYLQITREMAWIVPFTELLDRIKSPQTDSVRADLLNAYARGDRSPTTLIALASAHGYIGDGKAALRYANEVYATEDGAKLSRNYSIRARLQADALTIIRFDALVVLGRFADAALVMRNRRALSMQRNFMTVLTAWAYFLAGDDTNARIMLAQTDPPGPRFRLSQSISQRYRLLLAFMKHTYHVKGARADVVELYSEVIGWEDTARRNAHNHYGKRLRAVLDDLHAVISTP